MTIGERIKNRRLELELSQDQLAQKVGYKSRSSINKIELSRDLPLKKIQLMADALKTTPSYLMGWEDEEFIKVKIPFVPTDDEIDMLYKLRILGNTFKKAIQASVNTAYAEYEAEQKRADSVS